MRHRSGRVLSGVVLLVACLCAYLSPVPVAGQSGVTEWSRPINVSDSIGHSTDPTIVADQMGAVHLFWVEDLDNVRAETLGRARGDVIAYSQWLEGAWTKPVDVLVSPDGEEIWQPVAAVDNDGFLHLIWATMGGRLYYSSAHVDFAGTPHGWSQPLQLFVGLPTLALPAGLAVDSESDIHVVYSNREVNREILYTTSTDGGYEWSEPVSLSDSMPMVSGERLVSGGIAVTVDDGDGLHVGWSMFNDQGFGVAVYYSHSGDGGVTWSSPMIVGVQGPDDYEADWLNIATVGSGQIFLVWTGIGRPPGRLFRMSTDAGQTWTEPEHILQGMVGETESPRMVVDSANVVHFFTPARIDSEPRSSGTRYLYWTGSTWSEPFLIPGPSTHKADYYGGLRHTAAVRLGNELFDAWYDEGAGEIFVVRGKTGAPALQPMPFDSPPPIQPNEVEIAQAQPRSTPRLDDAASAEPDVTVAINGTLPPSPVAALSSNEILLAIGPVFVLILITVSVRLIGSRRL